MSGGIYKGGGGGRKPNLEWSRKGVLRAGGGGGGPTGTAVDVLVRLDTGSSGHKMTVADLNSSTLGLGTNSWSLVGTGTYPEWDNAIEQSTPGLSVSGVGYSDPNNGGLGFPLSPDPPGDDYCLFTLGTARQNFGIGFMIKLVDPDNVTFWSYNSMRMDTGGGGFFSCTVETSGASTFVIKAHGGSADGSAISSLVKNKWYWVTMTRTNTTSGVLRVYDPAASYSLVGTSTATLSASDSVISIRTFGLTDAGSIGGAAVAAVLQWDDLAMIYSTMSIIPAP